MGVWKLKQLKAAKHKSDSNTLPKKEENGSMELKQLKAAKQISNSNTLPKKGRSSPGGLLRYDYQPLIKRTTGFLAALVSSGLPTGVVLGQA